MPVETFGQYYDEVKEPRIGQHLWLDGIDGFDDQSLWYLKQGDTLQFIVNPDTHIQFLQHTIITVEILHDTNTQDWADTTIIQVQGFKEYYFNKPQQGENDFIELIDSTKAQWKNLYRAYQNISRYHFPIFPFLTFSELATLERTGGLDIQGSSQLDSRMHAQCLDNNSFRVAGAYQNYPNSGCIYDIADTALYYKTIIQARDSATWTDEKKFWDTITEG